VSVCLITMSAWSQKVYLGGGYPLEVKIKASSSLTECPPERTIDGSGMDYKIFESSRFMAQSTLGANIHAIEELSETLDFNSWIAVQCNIPPTYITPEMERVWKQILEESTDPENEFGPFSVHFNYAWWTVNMTNDDVLRQRIAYALSQIFVISINSDLRDHAEALSSFYDVLIKNALGNYRDLLMEVTLHPSMGYYLSHLNNPKEDPDNNIHPDENYAREIMQLFTIGLYALNRDGSRIKDNQGADMPSYNNQDIKQLAKVFTGLGGGGLDPDVTWKTQPEFGDGLWTISKILPLKMYENFHDKGTKSFLGFQIPANQTGMKDIQDAVDFLFHHPNTGPFVAYRLIQRLVKSNPSAAYIDRVASAFNDNGQGVRGDMRAVVTAILMDPEARGQYERLEPHHGMLREPMLRFTQIVRAFPVFASRDRYWNNGYSYLNSTRQHVLASPTVFNFYTPDYQPVGEISDAGLVAPEFKIHNSTTSLSYINAVNGWVGGVYKDDVTNEIKEWGSLFHSWESTSENPDFVRMLTSELEPHAWDSELIINELDKRFTCGALTDDTRNIIRKALNGTYWNWDTQNLWKYHRIKTAIYLFMISPDYNILR